MLVKSLPNALDPLRVGRFFMPKKGDTMERQNEAFYRSHAWRQTRALYVVHAHGLCERCGKPGDIVHHRVHLTRKNVQDRKLALGFENLELLCLDCHNAEHFSVSSTAEGLTFDESGDLIERSPRGCAAREGPRR